MLRVARSSGRLFVGSSAAHFPFFQQKWSPSRSLKTIPQEIVDRPPRPLYELGTKNMFKSLALSKEFYTAEPDPLCNFDESIKENENLIMPDATPVRHVLLNRPKKYNALDAETQLQLYKVLYKWGRDKSGRAIVLEGEGDYFSTGSDLKSLYQRVTEGEGHGVSPKDYYRHQYKLFYMLSRIRKPMIPFVDQKVLGAGVGLAINSNVSVGTGNACYSFTSGRVGLPLEGGSLAWLSKLPMNLGRMIILTGIPLSNADMKIFGMVTHNMFEGGITALKENLSVMWSQEWRRVLLSLAELSDFYGALQFSPAELEMIEKCFAPNSVEEIRMALEHENLPLAKKFLSLLDKSSPLASCLSLELLNQAEELNRAQCLKLEHRAVRRSVEQSPDFLEGVRSVVLDRKQPEWSKPLGAISPADLEPYLREYDDPTDELSLRDPFSDIRHIPYVPLGRVRLMNDYIQRKAKSYGVLDFSADDAVDQDAAIRSHLSNSGYRWNGERFEWVIGDEVEIEAEKKDNIELIRHENPLSDPEAASGEGSILHSDHSGSQAEFKKLVRELFTAVKEEKPFFEFDVDPKNPQNILKDEARAVPEDIDHLVALEQNLSSTAQDEIPTPWLIYHRNDPKQLRDDIDRYIVAMAESLAEVAEVPDHLLMKKVQKRGKIAFDRKGSFLDNEEMNAQVLYEFNHLVGERFDRPMLDFVAKDDKAAMITQLTDFERELKSEIQSVLGCEYEKVDSMISESFSLPLDDEYNALLGRILGGRSLSDSEKQFVVLLHRVFNTYIGRVQTSDEISAEKRKEFLLALRGARDEWLVTFEEEGKGGDPDLSEFLEDIKKKGATGALAAELVLSERCRQWIEAVLLEDESPYRSDVIRGIKQLRKDLKFRTNKIFKLEEGLRRTLKEVEEVGLREVWKSAKEDHYIKYSEMVREKLFRNIRGEEFGALFTSWELVFILKGLMGDGEKDLLFQKFVELSVYTAYKYFRKDTLQDPRNKRSEWSHLSEEEYAQRKAREEKQIETDLRFGGKKISSEFRFLHQMKLDQEKEPEDEDDDPLEGAEEEEEEEEEEEITEEMQQQQMESFLESSNKIETHTKGSYMEKEETIQEQDMLDELGEQLPREDRDDLKSFDPFGDDDEFDDDLEDAEDEAFDLEEGDAEEGDEKKKEKKKKRSYLLDMDLRPISNPADRF